METIDELKQAAEERRRECRVLSDAYSVSLSALTPLNFVLVVGAALFSLAAGATILIESNLLTKTQSGVLALVSGAFTIIHSKLGCDQYQGECRKLVSFYRGIAEDYGNLRFIGDGDEFRKRFLALNDQLAATAKNASALPFQWTVGKAQRRAA